MHGHGSDRAERVHSGIFWGKTKSGRSHSQTLGPDYGNYVGCSDRAEVRIGGKIYDGGGGISSPVVQAEEDVRTEVGDDLPADGILLIVEDDENLGSLSEIPRRGVPREEKVPDEEHKVHYGPEFDRLSVDGALRVFTGPEAEVKDNGDQVGDVVGSGVIEDGCRGNYGVHDYHGDGLFLSYRGILEPVGLEFPCEALVEPGVCLRVGWFSGVG